MQTYVYVMHVSTTSASIAAWYRIVCVGFCGGKHGTAKTNDSVAVVQTIPKKKIADAPLCEIQATNRSDAPAFSALAVS